MRLYDKYIKQLIDVNDETKTEQEHQHLKSRLLGWTEGVFDAAGYRFNGDRYYIEKFNSGEIKERPMCCGEFLDWQKKQAGADVPTAMEGRELVE